MYCAIFILRITDVPTTMRILATIVKSSQQVFLIMKSALNGAFRTVLALEACKSIVMHNQMVNATAFMTTPSRLT